MSISRRRDCKAVTVVVLGAGKSGEKMIEVCMVGTVDGVVTFVVLKKVVYEVWLLGCDL